MGFRPKLPYLYSTLVLVLHLYLYYTLLIPHTYASYIRHWCIFFYSRNTIQSVLLVPTWYFTWYQSYLLVPTVFYPYGIFKSNLYLPRCSFFRCVQLLWLHTAAVKTLRYSQATVRSRINTVRPLSSSNYCHRAKLRSRDLLNLIKSQDFIKLPSWVWEGVLEIY